MKAWITKYALTKGIYEEKVEIYSENGNAHNNTRFIPVFYKSGDWHTSKGRSHCESRGNAAEKDCVAEKAD